MNSAKEPGVFAGRLGVLGWRESKAGRGPAPPTGGRGTACFPGRASGTAGLVAARRSVGRITGAMRVIPFTWRIGAVPTHAGFSRTVR